MMTARRCNEIAFEGGLDGAKLDDRVGDLIHRESKKGMRATGMKANPDQLKIAGGRDKYRTCHLAHKQTQRLQLSRAVFEMFVKRAAKVQDQFDAAVRKNRVRSTGQDACILFERPDAFHERRQFGPGL